MSPRTTCLLLVIAGFGCSATKSSTDPRDLGVPAISDLADDPATGCDPWDRAATIGLVDGAQTIEIGRYMTPYGVAGAWDIDVTDLRPLFSGSRKVRGFIDTWIGAPGGWVLTATLKFVGGTPA